MWQPVAGAPPGAMCRRPAHPGHAVIHRDGWQESPPSRSPRRWGGSLHLPGCSEEDKLRYPPGTPFVPAASMVAVLISSRGRPDWIRAVPGATVLSDRRAFLESVRAGVVGILYVDGPAGELAAWLAAAAYEKSAGDVILAARAVPETVQAFRHTRFADVWWEHEGVDALWQRVWAVVAGDPRRTLQELNASARGLSFPVGAAARRLCDLQEGAIRSVAQLGTELGVPERTLRRAWRTGAARCSLKDAVDWALLLRGLVLARDAGPSASRIRIAMELGIHERTLERISWRLSGRTFASLRTSPAHRRETLQRFRALWPADVAHVWPILS